MRSDTCTVAVFNGRLRVSALAVIYYEAADNDSVPPNHPTHYVDWLCQNDPLAQTVPLYKFDALRDPDVTVTLDIKYTPNATDPKTTYVWEVNGVSFRGDYKSVIHSPSSFPIEIDLLNFMQSSDSSNGRSRRLQLRQTAECPQSRDQRFSQGVDQK